MLPTKDPEEFVNVTFDFTALSKKLNATIASFSIEKQQVLGSSNSLVIVKSSLNANVVTVQFSGGLSGEQYSLACLATFSNTEIRKLQDILPIS